MARSEYYVPLPEQIGRAITDAVRQFAKQSDLDAEVWIKDLPLWSVSKRDRGSGMIRRLQIGAYRLDETDEVRVIPQILWFDRKTRELVAPEQIDPSLIRSTRLWEVRTDRLLILLKDAWADLDRMAVSKNLGHVRIPISPHSDW